MPAAANIFYPLSKQCAQKMEKYQKSKNVRDLTNVFIASSAVLARVAAPDAGLLSMTFQDSFAG